jgi:UPF0755 protein
MEQRFLGRSMRFWKRISAGAGILSIAVLIGGLLMYANLFGPVDTTAVPKQYLITPSQTSATYVARDLETQGIARSALAVSIALREHGGTIRPGGYVIGKNMDAWTIASVLTAPPSLAFVTFPPAVRKEEIGEILADALGWSDAQKQEWNTVATSPDPDFTEGVYCLDTYFIPSDQSPAQIAARMRGRFTDMFAPYAAKAQQKNISWTKVLTLASIVDREAAKNDKALVAGILWNRIHVGMKLQADATLQYAKGAPGNWWPVPKSEDKYIDSPFNTYKYAGLPPHPINNPSMESIAAVLDPEKTDCLFYLHDASHQIHCSVTYAGQVRNVRTYLR